MKDFSNRTEKVYPVTVTWITQLLFVKVELNSEQRKVESRVIR